MEIHLCIFLSIIWILQNLLAYEIKPIRICKDGWHLFESSCFFVSSIEKTWQEAQDECNSMGGILAEPRTKSSQIYLTTLLKNTKNGNLTQSNQYILQVGIVWLGGKRSLSDTNSWVWSSTNIEIVEESWAPNEPNNRNNNEGCLEVRNSSNFMWNDMNCLVMAYFSCQQPPVSRTTRLEVCHGEILVLRCPARTLPVDSLIWSRSLNLSSYPLPKTVNDYNKTAPDLVFQPIQWYDDGVYDCHAVSNFKNVTYQFDVSVKTNVSSAIYAAEGDTIVLHCPGRLDSITSVVWKWSNNNIAKSLPKQASIMNKKTSSLVLKPIYWYNDGIFECCATSNLKTLSYRFNVFIDSKETLCPCSCEYKHRLIYWAEQVTYNRTRVELMEYLRPVLNQIEKEMTISKPTLSSFRRRKTSASDNRNSSYAIGFVGIAVLASISGICILVDVMNIVRFVTSCFH